MFIILSSLSCSHRGLLLSEQIPEKFMDSKQKSGFTEYDNVIGFVEEQNEFDESKIMFVSEDQKKRFLELKNQSLIYKSNLNKNIENNKLEAESGSEVMVIADPSGGVLGYVELNENKNTDSNLYSVRNFETAPKLYIKETDFAKKHFKNKDLISSEAELASVLVQNNSEQNLDESKILKLKSLDVGFKTGLTFDKSTQGVLFISK